SGAATGGSHGALFAGEPDRVSVALVAYGSDVCQTFTCATPDRSSPLLTISHVELSIDGHGGYPNSITTTGLLSTASAEQLRAAGTHYPTWLDPAYTRLPVSRADSSQLNAIAATATQWIAGATNPYDQAVAIETKLRTLKYTLSPP